MSEELPKRMEDGLGGHEQRLRALAYAISDVTYRMGPDWREMRELSGGGFIKDTESTTSAWLMDYIPREDQPRVNAAIGEAVRLKKPFELEHRVCEAGGSIGWVL